MAHIVPIPTSRRPAEPTVDVEAYPGTPAVPSAQFQPTLSPRFVAYVSQYLMDRQIDPDPLLAASGLTAEAASDNDTPIPVERICELFCNVAEYTQNPYLGLQLSAGYHYESSSMLILAFMAAPTVRDALETLWHYDKYVDSAIEIRLDAAGGLSCFQFDLLAPETVRTEFLCDYLAAFIADALYKATRAPVPIARVAFTYETDKPNQPMTDYFRAPVAHGAIRNAIHIDESFMDKPLRTANPLLYDVLRNALTTYYSREGTHFDFMQAVHREVLSQFKHGAPTAQSIAAQLGLSPRSLRRRLAQHGRKLQEVKNDARLARATFLLQHTHLPLTAIAHDLGFSELSAFSRAFKSWTQTSPQIYREHTQR